jgi:NAD(P) transhydrogenase
MAVMRYDLVVIGSGPAGEKAALQAAYFGKRVALIERDTLLGGASAHTGTLPSKTFRETALYLSGYHARELYGLSLSVEPNAEVAALVARKSAIGAAAALSTRHRLEAHRVEVIRGRARFLDPHTVEVESATGTRTIAGEYLLIATGSSPVRPSDIDFSDPDINDSDGILAIDRLPDRMLVLGGGVIGCEYASMFAALKVKVTLVDARPDLLPFLDEELVADLRRAMEKLGVTFRLGQKWTRVGRQRTQIVVALEDGSTLAADKLLYAAGRGGNTAGLGLEKLGLAADARGNLAVNAHYQTAVEHVYAAGDVVGFPALASTSMEQGRIAACHAFEITYKQALSTLLPFGIYTIPEVSCVGETEQGARQKGLPFVVGRASFRDLARGQITGDLEGKTKLVVNALDRRILGVHVIGERASELVHIGQAVMACKGTVDTFIDLVLNVPTLAESYKYAAYSALQALERRALAGPGAA